MRFCFEGYCGRMRGDMKSLDLAMLAAQRHVLQQSMIEACDHSNKSLPGPDTLELLIIINSL